MTFLPLIVAPKNANTLLLFIHDTIVFKICWTKYVFPLCVGPTTKSENLWRKLNSRHGLVTMDAVTFRKAFVGCRTEQVFLRTHLISSTICVGHPGSEPEQCLCEIENLFITV